MYTLFITKSLHYMTSLQHIAEHKAFMKSFERNYPELCKIYCLDILPAVDDTGFINNWKNMDSDMFMVLMQITNYYYYLVKN